MAVALEAWQVGTLVAGYVVLFVLPAVWMARKARRDGDNPLVWGSLVLVGSVLGIVEYYHHRSILKRRARRAQKAKPDEGDAGGGAER